MFHIIEGKRNRLLSASTSPLLKRNQPACFVQQPEDGVGVVDKQVQARGVCLSQHNIFTQEAFSLVHLHLILEASRAERSEGKEI